MNMRGVYFKKKLLILIKLPTHKETLYTINIASMKKM